MASGRTDRPAPGPCQLHRRRGQPIRLIQRALLLALALLVLAPALSACRSGSRVLGIIDEQAPVALVRYEAIEKDLAGVVYREILDLPAFLAESKLPVLLVFHDAGAAVDRQLIPMVEQFADDYKDKAAVVFIDAEAKPSLGALYGIETLPQYVLVKSGQSRLTMSGFDATTRAGFEQMLRTVG